MNEVLYSGLETIAERVNVKKKTVVRWIREYGFPAFKDTDSKSVPWRCLESSLCHWLKMMETRGAINNKETTKPIEIKGILG